MIDLYGREWQLIDGALVTVKLCLTVVPFMFLLGLAGAGAKLSRVRALNVVGDAYTTIVRGVPELLIIMTIYFGGTMGVQWVWENVLGSSERIDVPAFWSGVFALSLVQGAFASEVLRAAILAIPPGQLEAARAIGLTSVQLFFRIVLPQLWRYALPGLNNLFQILIKDTALISVVGLDELLRASAIGAGTEKAPFTFYGVAALIYLLFTTLSLLVFSHLEKRAARGFHRA